MLPLVSPLIAIVSALLVGALLIILAGANPIAAYTALFQESLTTYFGFGNTLTKMTPLLLTSLGVLVALRARQFNIGGEGQIYLGALGSALVGLYFQGLPALIHTPLALLAGCAYDYTGDGPDPGYYASSIAALTGTYTLSVAALPSAISNQNLSNSAFITAKVVVRGRLSKSNGTSPASSGE